MALGSVFPPSPATAAASPAEVFPGQILVGFREDAESTDRELVLGNLGARPREVFPSIDASLVVVPAGAAATAIERLEADPRVEYAEPNYVLRAAADPGASPSDPSFGQQWALDNVGQEVEGVAGSTDADIDAAEAWAVTTGSTAVVVGVVDSGLDLAHEDLAASVWINGGEDCAGCRSDNVDNDGNGYVDDWRGWDFVNDDNDPSDDNGHGSHVAGTIGAAGNNGVGVAGVSWSVTLMPLKFLDENGVGTTADAVEAVLYGARNGANVLNSSWGGGDFSQALLDAIQEADASGALFVAAAGNERADLDRFPSYPASYDSPNVLSVTASDSADGLAPFANVGVSGVDLAAPGVDILSAWRGNSYRFLTGTSMATAMTTGAAALAKAAFPAIGHLDLKALLLGTADPVASLSGTTATGGRLNVDRAVRGS